MTPSHSSPSSAQRPAEAEEVQGQGVDTRASTQGKVTGGERQRRNSTEQGRRTRPRKSEKNPFLKPGGLQLYLNIRISSGPLETTRAWPPALRFRFNWPLWGNWLMVHQVHVPTNDRIKSLISNSAHSHSNPVSPHLTSFLS